MNKKSKIYIAGHTGLVGSAIKRKLEDEGYKNLILRTHAELDLMRQKEVELFFEQERPAYVFLCAARVGGIQANSTYKAEFIYDNIMIASNVIHASYKSGVKKLLNLGSSCIYPKFAPQPMQEDYLLSGPLEPTNEPYAIAKITAIKLCQYYNEQYGTNFISVMPTNLYGPNDNFDLETSHVLPALIRKMHLAKLLSENKIDDIKRDFGRYGNTKIRTQNFKLTITMDSSPGDVKVFLDHYGISSISSDLRPQTSDLRSLSSHLAPRTSPSVIVHLWGTGTPFREFLYVDDLAEACEFLMENFDAVRFSVPGSGLTNNFINIGTGEDKTINELAHLVKEVVGFDGEIRWDSSKPDGTPRKLLDVSKIKALGWSPKVTLKEGIKKTYQWYLSGQCSLSHAARREA